jgi:NADP-dependent 3-hydroxy acid dehydrogenase YdfG
LPFVTGASQGIGCATAIRLARDFEAIVLTGLMAYLVSKETRWLTGASVRMDGGEIKGI